MLQIALSALQEASVVGYIEIVEVLLRYGADVNAYSGEYGTALIAASSQGYQEVARTLLEQHANLTIRSERYGTAFEAAAKDGHHKIVELLSSGKDEERREKPGNRILAIRGRKRSCVGS